MTGRWAEFDESCKKAFKAFVAASERAWHTLVDGSSINLLLDKESR